MISVEEKFIPINKRFSNEYHLNDALKELGNPEKNIPAINIVGTNGKGSVSRYTSLGLMTIYKKVGVFTSPAFVFQNERIAINNDYISDDDLKKYLKSIAGLIKKYNLTFFEIWTLIATLYFNDNKVNVAVIEAGIGGIKDATYNFTNQIATLLTAVDFDHTEILGNTIEEILSNKVLMAKPGTQLYVSDDNLKYKKEIENIVAGKNIEVLYAPRFKDNVLYQEGNKGLVKFFLENKYKIYDYSYLNKSNIAGRFEILNDKPLFLIDGAHNPNGIEQLIMSIERNFPAIDPIILVGSSYNKDYLTSLEEIKSKYPNLYITNFDHFKSWDVNDINIGTKVIDWKSFLTKMINSKKDIIVCGSLYFIPLVKQWYMETFKK
ncbi:bifunctional folylpolyglutamate synthase/dihydrofolate synthase [Mesoplasma lactucae]|uniref:Dihydrofolate synthase n=1 Tax=Mesoplasma lactucae ATCC 49193 TaxID=81460 RepID=A0A291IS06_9MOLU|nr:cyanophycin synthetase [Mesoplasma lactucae]ATG97642.1 dihydrofolate synthase [Mesoplasma lactucae ATCC 49193]ATZ19895.1 folylpolyglutamate synthase [Mesoplasma lactucae ATCC 49193]MCL8216758.1 UDP-N-acetylmuramoyl-L-alanyl-D-glutamate--2,6-diaminopimelate ligase [Mesoplasma lactucae ATCC 49193]